MQPEKIKQ